MQWLSIFLKGMAMGAADAVPGVSGGTIALITGIYNLLLQSLTRFSPKLFSLLKQQGLKAVWQYINGWFLLTLFSGILVSILSLAKIITWLLHTYPIPLWGFFFGLVLISTVFMLKQIERVHPANWIFFVVGIIFAYGITSFDPIQWEMEPSNIVFAGAIAICAMILPGISGSFILLMLGVYSPILEALQVLDLKVISLFIFGCILGLLSFSRFLHMLLEKIPNQTLLFLSGIMLGTLPKIWPWKLTTSWRLNHQGESVPFIQQNVSPFQYDHLTGQSSHLFYAVFSCCLAIALITFVQLKQRQKHQKK